MATMHGTSSKYSEDILLTKQLDTTLAINAKDKFVDREVEFTLSVQSGVDAANTATADVNVQSGGTGNISGSIGTKTTTQPTSGYYIKLQAEGSGSSQITTAGWVDAGALAAASTTATKYFPIDSATMSLGTPTVSSTGLVSVEATTTAGYIAAGTDTATVQLESATATVTGTNTVTPSASVAGSNVTLSNTNNGISVTATGGGSASASASAVGKTAGYLAAGASIGTATINASSSSTTASSYISGVTLTAPTSGTRSFSVTVPNGAGTQTVTFTVNAAGNVTIE